MTLWLENLERLVAAVEEKLAAAEAVTGLHPRGVNYDEWNKQSRAAEAALIEHFSKAEDAKFGEKSGAHSVCMAGIRSSSTIGVSSALRNWRTAAQLKLAQEGPSDPINLQGSGPAPIELRGFSQ